MQIPPTSSSADTIWLCGFLFTSFLWLYELTPSSGLAASKFSRACKFGVFLVVAGGAFVVWPILLGLSVGRHFNNCRGHK